jgi:hypothetical protein
MEMNMDFCTTLLLQVSDTMDIRRLHGDAGQKATAVANFLAYRILDVAAWLKNRSAGTNKIYSMSRNFDELKIVVRQVLPCNTLCLAYPELQIRNVGLYRIDEDGKILLGG